MLGKLKSILLGNASFAATAENPTDRKQLALAALLIEMARADFDEHYTEHSEIAELLASNYELSPVEARLLIERAQAASNTAVCLFDATRALHECLDADEKREVIRMLWQVAYTDNKLDKYEDYLVRKIADLLYVSHSDVVRLKDEVSRNP
jgi:uncharacterized tellurite resistance protein B-like protein